MDYADVFLSGSWRLLCLPRSGFASWILHSMLRNEQIHLTWYLRTDRDLGFSCQETPTPSQKMRNNPICSKGTTSALKDHVKCTCTLCTCKTVKHVFRYLGPLSLAGLAQFSQPVQNHFLSLVVQETPCPPAPVSTSKKRTPENNMEHHGTNQWLASTLRRI